MCYDEQIGEVLASLLKKNPYVTRMTDGLREEAEMKRRFLFPILMHVASFLVQQVTGDSAILYRRVEVG